VLLIVLLCVHCEFVAKNGYCYQKCCYYPNSYILGAHRTDPCFENPLLWTGSGCRQYLKCFITSNVFTSKPLPKITSRMFWVILMLFRFDWVRLGLLDFVISDIIVDLLLEVKASGCNDVLEIMTLEVKTHWRYWRRGGNDGEPHWISFMTLSSVRRFASFSISIKWKQELFHL